MRTFSGTYRGDLFDALARLRPPLILTILLFLTGTMGYMGIDGFPFLDALYMTVISVATVGFGEVHPLSKAGQIFTMGLIMSGFAVFTYSVGVFVEVITRRDIFGLVRIERMEARIKSLADHYIIVGYNPIAQELATLFKKRGIQFVVMENEQNRLRKAKQDGVEFFVQGEYYENEAYKRAGIETARGVITTFKNDADNITVVVTGRIFEETTGRDLFIMSTCSDLQSKARLERVGADYVIRPDSLIGHRISALAARPPHMVYESIMERVAFGEYSELDILEVPVTEETPIAGQTIRESDIRRQTGAYVVAIKRGKKKIHINPNPDDDIRSGDTLMVIGTPTQLSRMESFMQVEMPVNGK